MTRRYLVRYRRKGGVWCWSDALPWADALMLAQRYAGERLEAEVVAR